MKKRLCILNVVTLLGLAFVTWSQAVEPTKTNEEIMQFLSKGNNTEAVNIRQLTVSQAGKKLAWYSQIDNEERRNQLRQRPILNLTNPIRPFVRGIDFVVLVDRQFGMQLQFSADFVRGSRQKAGALEVQPIQVLYAYLTPGNDEEITLKATDGYFTFDIPQNKNCSFLRIQARSRDERHEIKIILLNRNKPVTFSNR